MKTGIGIITKRLYAIGRKTLFILGFVLYQWFRSNLTRINKPKLRIDHSCHPPMQFCHTRPINDLRMGLVKLRLWMSAFAKVYIRFIGSHLYFLANFAGVGWTCKSNNTQLHWVNILQNLVLFQTRLFILTLMNKEILTSYSYVYILIDGDMFQGIYFKSRRNILLFLHIT